MEQRFYEALQANPIIAAIRDDAGMEACLKADVQMVFVLYGDLCSIGDMVRRIKESGKLAVVHVDRITGLASKEVSVDYLHQHTQTDGIISTRVNLVQRAKELGMFSVLRTFVIDSMALESVMEARIWRPDAVDILPGLMPTIIQRVSEGTGLPVLAGGLITQKQEIMQALDAGALAISTTDPKAWEL